MASAKTNAEVIIDGKVYTLSGYEEEDYLQKIATYLNGKIEDFQAMDGYKNLSVDMKQVLINILSNAIKFTEAPGSVKMTVECTAVFEGRSSLKFVIKDTGIGMDKSFIPKVFDTFAQGHIKGPTPFQHLLFPADDYNVVLAG